MIAPRLRRPLSLLLAGLLGGAGAASALVRPAVPPVDDLWTQPPAVAGFTPGSAAAAAAADAVAARAGDALALWSDAASGSLRAAYAGETGLSAPVEGSAEAVAWAFLKENRALWRASEADLAELELVRVFSSPPSGLQHVHFRQVHDGLPVFAAEVRLHLDADGRVVAVTSDLHPGLGRLPAPLLDAAAAAGQAALDVGRDPGTLPPATPGLRAGERLADPADPLGFGLASEAVVFPAPGGARLAWRIGIGVQGTVPAYYDVVIDAVSGETLARINRVRYAGGRAFPLANPPLTGPGCPASGAQQDLSFDATAASPAGYVAPTLSGTFGNNVRAQEDRNNRDYGAAAPPTSAGRWDHGFTNSYAASGNAATDLNAAITNLFWTCNFAHDRLHSRGFDEAAGNFQAGNFGRGGTGNDEVWADAQDGSGTDNANFGTDAEGFSPRMQMYLWSNPRRDGDFDNTIIVHEYGHGVSHRLVGVNCLGSFEAGSMGEGWSDFFANSFYDTPVVGAYALNNCSRGVRRASYATAVYPNTYGDICTGSFGCEVHDDGEIWAAALWRMREAIAQARGGDRTVAACIAETLVVEGMKLTPCNPTMLQARDAILGASRQTHPELQCLIWGAFANRGLGFSATSTGGASRTARREAFDLPAACATCPAFTSPTVNSDTSQPNQVTLSWPAVPGATGYLVHVSERPCSEGCAPPSSRLLASVGGTSYTDLNVPGAIPRSYRVRAVSGTLCVGPAACKEVIPGGLCNLLPRFAADVPGATWIEPSAVATPCGLVVHWSEAASRCPDGPAVVYNLYRDTSSLFVPTMTNRIATVPGPATSYTDTTGLVTGTTYYYLVRAEDTTRGGPAPSGGNEDGNLVRRSSRVRGAPAGTADFFDSLDPNPLPGWTHYALPAAVPDDWTAISDANSGGTKAWRTRHIQAQSFNLVGAEKGLVMPPLSLTAASVLTFDHKIETESQWDGGVLEISTDGGNTWQDLSAQITAAGYNNITLSMMTFINPGGSNRLWGGVIPAGFGAFQRVTVDLGPFAGARDALIRFRSLWDASSPATYRGWYIDNVRVTATTQYADCSLTVPCSAAASAAALGSTEVCLGGSVRLDASGSTLTSCSGSALYQWFEGASAIPAATGVTYDTPTTLPVGSYAYAVEVTCSTDASCRSRSAPVAVTVGAPGRVAGLLGVRRNRDADFSWSVEPSAAGGYRLYRTDDKTLIPFANARGPVGVIRVGATAPDPAATALSDAGAVDGPPANPARLFYQVVAVCSDGITEGEN